jgi:hypothetical protein
LLRTLTGGEVTGGGFDALTFRFSGRGSTVERLLQQASARLTVDNAALTYTHQPDTEPVNLSVRRLEASLDRADNSRVVIDGSFSDTGVGVTPFHLAGSAMRFVYSYLYVPVLWITQPRIPADGSDICDLDIGRD